jgi:glucose/arabinose dehydrogenase
VAFGLDQPLFVTHAPGDYDRIFVVERTGAIRIIKRGVLLPEYFLDVDPLVNSLYIERGLLGMAFHPGFPAVNAFFINYTDNNGHTVVARYSVSSNPDVANPGGDTILFISQPAPNHNGGWLGFGPDGYLYVAMGDGGGQRDPNGLGQGTAGELLGNILRIDVDADDFPGDERRDYAIPSDNPFVGIAGEDEIWAYGLRNPWRNAFDSLTGDFYIADVGEGASEEVNFQPASSGGGENYGWDCFEGNTCTDFNVCEDCDTLDWVPPIHTYGHTGQPLKCSITGGEVYRGCAIPDLAGTYFFGDYCTADLWSLRYENGQVTEYVSRTSELDPAGAWDIKLVTGFGRDAAGEIYICESGSSGTPNGEVFKIVPEPPLAATSTQPPNLSIDARTPVLVGMATGWDRVTLHFGLQPFCLSEHDFTVSVDGGTAPPSDVEIVSEIAPNSIEVTLSAPIAPLAWTTIFHHESRMSLQLGYLPGDVDASRTTTVLDLLSLIDALNGEATYPFWSLDINRSESLESSDVILLIELFDGVVDGQMYLGASLP